MESYAFSDNFISKNQHHMNSYKDGSSNYDILNITIKSYYLVFYIMIFAFILTIVSSILVNNNYLRKILMIEILITGISSFMYYSFIDKIKKFGGDFQNNGKLDLKVVDILRYNGWALTTPLMLIALCLVLMNTTKINISLLMIFGIIILDYLMLLFGYLGELNILNRPFAMVLGFIPFFIIFYIIFNTFIITKYNLFNYLIFGIYFIIWTGYGIAYMFDEKIKNILTNMFDLISKGFVAIILSIIYLMK
jgi:bacteriorhodopsin